jgi:hypothetical protein
METLDSVWKFSRSLRKRLYKRVLGTAHDQVLEYIRQGNNIVEDPISLSGVSELDDELLLNLELFKGKEEAFTGPMKVWIVACRYYISLSDPVYNKVPNHIVLAFACSIILSLKEARSQDEKWYRFRGHWVKEQIHCMSQIEVILFTLFLDWNHNTLVSSKTEKTGIHGRDFFRMQWSIFLKCLRESKRGSSVTRLLEESCDTASAVSLCWAIYKFMIQGLEEHIEEIMDYT